MAEVVAIILARGGSKGIPGKNIIGFCGKPLITWTIEQLQQSEGINSIWLVLIMRKFFPLDEIAVSSPY